MKNVLPIKTCGLIALVFFQSVLLFGQTFENLMLTSYDAVNQRLYFSWETRSSEVASYTFIVRDGQNNESVFGPTASFNSIGNHTDYVNADEGPHYFTLRETYNNGTSYEESTWMPTSAVANFSITSYNYTTSTINYEWDNTEDVAQMYFHITDGSGVERTFGPSFSFNGTGHKSDYMEAMDTGPYVFRIESTLSNGVIAEDTFNIATRPTFQNLEFSHYDFYNNRIYFSWENLSTSIIQIYEIVDKGLPTEQTFGPSTSLISVGPQTDYQGYSGVPHKTITVKAVLANGNEFEETVAIPGIPMQNLQITSYDLEERRLDFSWENLVDGMDQLQIYKKIDNDAYELVGSASSIATIGSKNDFIGFDEDEMGHNFTLRISNPGNAATIPYSIETTFILPEKAFSDFRNLDFDTDNNRIYYSWENLSSNITQIWIVLDEGLPTEITGGPYTSIIAPGTYLDYITYSTFPKTITMKADMTYAFTFTEKIDPLPAQEYQNFTVDGYDTENRRINISWENLTGNALRYEFFTRESGGDWVFRGNALEHNAIGNQATSFPFGVSDFGKALEVRLEAKVAAPNGDYYEIQSVTLPEIAFQDLSIFNYDSDNKNVYFSWENIVSDVISVTYTFDAGLTSEQSVTTGSFNSIGEHSDFWGYSTFPKNFRLAATLSNGTVYSKTISPFPQQEFRDFTIDSYNTSSQTISISWDNLTSNAVWYKVFYRIGEGNWIEHRQNFDVTTIGEQSWTFDHNDSWFGQTIELRLFAGVPGNNSDYYEQKSVSLPSRAIANLYVDIHQKTSTSFYFGWDNLTSDITDIAIVYDIGLPTESIRGPFNSSSLTSQGNHYASFPYENGYPETATVRAYLPDGATFEQIVAIPEEALEGFKVDNYEVNHINFSWTNLSSQINRIELNTNVDNEGWVFAWETSHPSVINQGDRDDYVTQDHDSRLSNIIGKEVKLRLIVYLNDGKEYREEVTFNNFKPFEQFRLSYSPTYGVFYTNWTNLVGLEDVWVEYDGNGYPLGDNFNSTGGHQEGWHYNTFWFEQDFPSVELFAIYNGVTYSQSLSQIVPVLTDVQFSYDEEHDEIRVDWNTNAGASYYAGDLTDPSLSEILKEFRLEGSSWSTTSMTHNLTPGTYAEVLIDDVIPGAVYNLELNPRLVNGNVNKGYKDQIEVPVQESYGITALNASFQGDENSNPVTIKLTWKAPTDLAKWGGLANFEGYYKIYRKEREAGGNYSGWTLLAGSHGFGDDFSTTPEYTDTDNLDYCKQYTYSVEMFGSYNGGTEFFIFQQLAHDVKSNGAEDPPSNLQASTDRCDSSIEVTWEWYQENPDEFRIERFELVGNDTVAVDTKYVLGEDRSYVFQNVTKNKWYLFRMTTKGFCGYVSSTPSKVKNGFSPDEPSAASNISASFKENPFEVTLQWADNSINEEKFIIERIETGGSREEFVVESSAFESSGTGRTVTFLDDNISNCAEYTYKVYAWNGCSTTEYGTEGVNDITIRPSLSLTDIFSAISMTSSKGYYTDYVDLRFIPSSTYNKATKFKIFNRELGSAAIPQLVVTLDIEARQYKDYEAEAGVLYEYFIVAARECGDGEVFSFDVNGLYGSDESIAFNLPEGVGYAVSFRNPVGIINGNITYSGGIAVKDVKVVAERENGNTGNALHFDGDDYVQIPYQETLQPENTFTLSAWILPDLSVTNIEMTIARKWDAYSLSLVDNKIKFGIADQNGDWHFLFADIEQGDNDLLVQGRYAYVAAQLDGEKMKIFVDGEEIVSAAWLSGATVHQDETLFYIGGLGQNINNFRGEIDEVRFYDRALDDMEILQSHGSMIKVDANGLMGYWRMNEGAGYYVYDASKEGTLFHKNEGRIYGASWSEEIPSSSQLGFSGFTNENGNYSIAGVQYRGTGENFRVIPTVTLGGVVHEFDPQEKILFIGEGNTVQNGVDFEDVSSFTVSGQVVFKFGENNSGSSEAGLYIDGIPVSDGFGNIIKTDDNGQFTIQVPIGAHLISVKKGLHDFENEGVWPPNGEPFDFQESVSGLEFFDLTTRKLIGRVVGGTREGNKVVGFNKSVNNLGQAQFNLVSDDQLINVPITTDATSGEFIIDLPPKRYNLYRPNDSQPGIFIANNQALEFGALEPIDLTQSFFELFEEDTVYNNEGEIVEINKFAYNEKRNFIYRTTPQMTVKEGTEGVVGESLLGARSVTVKDIDENSFTINTIANDAYSLGRPVYSMGQRYGVKISLFETYTNYDSGSPVDDTVPVTDAEIYVSNNIGPGFFKDEFGDTKNYPPGNAADLMSLSSETGDTTYFFTSDEPNLTVNASDASLSYTRTLQITAVAGGNTVSWPNATNTSEAMYVYALGSKGTATNIITKAPDLVEFILRDPPGSESHAFIEKGETFTNSSSFSMATELNLNMDLNIGGGNNTLVGGGICGVGEIFEAKALATVGLNMSTEIGAGLDLETTYEFTEAFYTRDDNINVGAQGDLFIGKSENFRYGISDNLKFIPAGECGSPEVLCVDGFPSVFAEDGTEFKLGRKYGFYLVPHGIPTYFIYSQNHIENYLIPDLLTLRNTVLLNSANYTSHLNGDDTNFGKNNDDPVWGGSVSSATPLITEDEDFTGSSYTFIPPSNDEIDSIRWYNQQIRLWQETLGRNEQEKVEAINAGGANNYTFSGGAVVTNSSTYTQSGAFTTTFELAVGASIGTSFDVDGYGVGLEIDVSAGIEMTVSSSSSLGKENSMTYGYELNDPDVGDFMSVDVFDGKNGNGPIFSIVGGQTMCPHEPEVITKYYQAGTQLSARTLQREKPALSTSVGEVFNVPADQAAVFTLTLANESESFDDQLYVIELIESTNPNGAVLKIDGVPFDSNREFLVPGSGAINKTLTIERGPYEYDYENIRIMLRSTCQFDPTDNDIDIKDEVSLSVHFIPTCTKADIISPADQWIVNNSFEDVLPITFGGYNINYEGFKKVELQYKPKSASNWILLEKFYRDQQAADNDGASGAALLASVGNTTTFQWELGQLPDGRYDLQVVSVCELASETSDKHSGLIDRTNPVLFGSAQPSDGILSYGDDIVVQFTEPINESLLVPFNFNIKGVLNGAEIRHDASIYFEGSSAHYMKIPEGFDFRQKSYALEMYVKRGRSGTEEILFSQGTTAATAFNIGFTADDKPFMSMAGKTLIGQTSITDNEWHHLVFMVDVDKTDAEIFIDAQSDNVDNEFFSDYQEIGELYVGRQAFSPLNSFQGSIHELRIWDKALSPGLVAQVAVKQLARTQPGLIGNWRLDEIHGTIARDHVSFRNAEVYGIWKMEPGGKAIAFDGSDDVFETTSPSFASDLSFTIELWFKTSHNGEMTLWSNGKGDGTDANATGWALGMDANGNINLSNNSQLKTSINTFNDGLWHHVALVANKLSNTAVIVDEQEELSVESDLLTGFGGPKWWIGARGWFDGSVENKDRYFNGSIDEIRVWNYAKKLDQIELNQYNQLLGDEPGLMIYYPFELYLDEGGVQTINQTTNNQSISSNKLPVVETLVGGVALTDEAATVKLARPVKTVNFSYASNTDKIIFTLLEPDSLLENVILEISVDGIQDLNGNKQPAPIVWNAFVDKNQVVWVEDSREINMKFGDEVSFEANISNGSGEIYSYNISNIPSWLTVSPSSGTINPLTSRSINITIDPNVNIGHFEQYLYLSTEFGFEEKFLVDLNVFEPAPSTWVVNEADFEYSMNVIAQVQIGGVVSRDREVLVAAFVDDQIRGVTSLSYIEAYDNYQAFLTVYSNLQTGEEVKFKVWNAAEGRVHSNITPVIDYISNQTVGLPSSPTLLVVPDYLEKEVDLVSGWQWLSFNIASPDFANVDQFMNSFFAAEGDIIKGQYAFDQYDVTSGWFGSLSAGGGLKNNEMYKIKVASGASLTYEGGIIDPTTVQIDVDAGWNWIGFVSQRNIDINEALAGFAASEGDEIKSQTDFAVYTGSNFGWIGSLTDLKPGNGYMMKSAQATNFTFPAIGIIPRTGLKYTREEIFFNKAKKQLEEYGESFDLGNTHAKNMSIVAKSANELTYDYLVVKVNGKIKDIAIPILNPLSGKHVYFFSVGGDIENEKVEFYAFINNNMMELKAEKNVAFNADVTVGNPETPLVLNDNEIANIIGEDILSQFKVTAYPNPVKDHLQLSLENVAHETIQIVLFNIAGQQVFAKSFSVNNQKNFNMKLNKQSGFDFGSLPKGYYNLKVISGGESETIKIIR